MPIYDYKCQHCDNTFSALVPSSSTPESEVECPKCKEHEARKLLSMRAAYLRGGGSGAAVGSGCSAPAGSGFT